jgi:ABC-type Fe3+ transport system permease subunit
MLLVLLNIAVPIWALVYSLRIPFSIPSMFNEFAPEVEGAIFVACVAAVIATISAFSAAGRWTPGLIFFAGASFLIGGQLLAIAMIRIFNRELFPGFTNLLGNGVHHVLPPHLADVVTAVIKEPFNLADWAYGAWPVPVVAYVGRFGWLALAGGRGTWGRSWKELRDMAAIDGAGAFRTAVSVVWPLSWPTLVAGALLVGALSMTEVPATVLLFPVNPQVLTPRLMTWLHQARSDSMIEASLMMMMTVLVPAAAALVLISIGRKWAELRTVKNRM